MQFLGFLRVLLGLLAWQSGGTAAPAHAGRADWDFGGLERQQVRSLARRLDERLRGAEGDGHRAAYFEQWCALHGSRRRACDGATRRNFERSLELVRRVNKRKGAAFWVVLNKFAGDDERELKTTGRRAPTAAGAPSHQDRGNCTGVKSEASDSVSPADRDAFFRLWGLPLPRPTPAYGVGGRRFPPVYPAVDWADLGMVSPVRDQGRCGACATFTAVAMVESHLLIAGAAHPTDLSEQHVVDCAQQPYAPGGAPGGDAAFGNYGCAGGRIDVALLYAAFHGVHLEVDYPYAAADGACRELRRRPLVRPPPPGTPRPVLPSRDPTALMLQLRHGPVGVAFAVDQAFTLYGGGVYQPSGCTYDVDHAMLLTGYGFDRDGGGGWYWRVKNSWGEDWGEAGYARIQLTDDRNGPCGMYAIAFYMWSGPITAG